MTRTILTLVTVCFLAVSLAVNFGAVQSSADEISRSLELSTTVDELHSQLQSNGKDQCQCEQNTGVLNLVCGVTLALLSEPGWAPTVQPGADHTSFEQVSNRLELVWKLKRPPRSFITIENAIV